MAAVVGVGTTVTFGTTTLSVISIRGPGMTRTKIDTSYQGSEDGWMTCVGGLIDPGEMTVEVLLEPADGALLDDSDPANLTVTFSDGGTLTGKAFISGVSPGVPFQDKATCEITFTFTGEVELHGGA